MSSLLITKNIVKRMIRAKQSFLFLALLPVLAGIIVTVIAPDSNVAMIRIGIANISEDDQVYQSLAGSNRYHVQLMEEDQLQVAVEQGNVVAGIAFPVELAKIYAGSEKVRLIAMENNTRIQELQATVQVIMSTLALDGAMPIVLALPENTGYDRPRIAMGMLTLFMLMFVGSGVGLLLDDKKGKTFMRTYCAPVREVHVVLGHLGANLLLGILQITLFLLVTKYLLNIDWGMSLFNVFLLLVGFLITAIGLGIGLAGFVQDSNKYSVLLTIVAMPTSLLGGGFFPMEMLPDTLQKVANFVPQKWVMEAFDLMYFEQVGIGGVTTQLMIIVIFGLALFTFGVQALKPTVSDL